MHVTVSTKNIPRYWPCWHPIGDPFIMDVDLDVESDDEGKLHAAQEAAKVRKRAGLPDLASETLPSTIAIKMMLPGRNPLRLSFFW